MIDGYEFVYSMLYNGHVFYIGRSKDVLKRYSMHLSTASKTGYGTQRFISNILENDGLPDMDIIDYLPVQEAKIMEANIIHSFTAAGQTLTNSSHNARRGQVFYRFPLNIPKEMNKPDMCALIRYRADMRIHYKRMEIGLPSFRLPKDPFLANE